MLKAVLIDDEPKALESLSWELENYTNDVNIIGKFTDPEEALLFLDNATCDCLFLDIEMPTMDGFQFLERIKTKDFAVVITTAYNEFAIKAIKQDAVDYLLKPVDIDDLRVAITKIKKHLKQGDVSSEKFEQILFNYNEKYQKKRIPINTDGKLVFLEACEILYIESDGNYCTLYLEEAKKIVVTKKLKEINELLPVQKFLRIHNSYIVNLEKVKEFIKAEGYIILSSNHKLPISRQRKAAFLRRI